jgi:hypothetical protein
MYRNVEIFGLILATQNLQKPTGLLHLLDGKLVQSSQKISKTFNFFPKLS